MKLRQLLTLAANQLDNSPTADLARSLYDLADNGSGESIYQFLVAIKPLAEYIREAGI